MNKFSVIAVATLGFLVACTPGTPSHPQIAGTLPSAASSATAASPTIQQTSLATILPIIHPTSKFTTSPTISPTPLFTTLPANPTAEGTSVSSIYLLIPKIAPASEIIDIANISSFFLQHSSPLTIALDDKYVYWVDHSNPGFLYRISQSGGSPEVVARSLYEDGRLDCIDLQTSGHWMILCDADTPYIPSNWKIRAINLDDLSQTVLLSSDDTLTYVFSSFDISLDGNSVLWACSTIKDNALDENVVNFVNLDAGETRELLRKKADTLVRWMLSLSGNQAVIQQAFADTQGVKSVLNFLDLTNGNMSVLLTDEGSAWPVFSFPWLIWTQLGAKGYVQSFVTYNLGDDQKWRTPIEGAYPTKPRMNGSWLYWSANPMPDESRNAIYIYAIEKNTTYVFVAQGKDQYYETVYFRANTIAWVRNVEFSKAGGDMYLEWATIK